MHLIPTVPDTEQMKRRLAQGPITGYKVLMRDGFGFLRSEAPGHEWKPGWNCSARRWYHAVFEAMQLDTTKEAGFHVFLFESNADLVKRLAWQEQRDFAKSAGFQQFACEPIVVPVLCHAPEFVAAGMDWNTQYLSAIFTKVYLPSEEYVRAAHFHTTVRI